MRVLYQFPQSVFSRRTRLSLAHKGLEVELRDARADAAHLAEARRPSALGTLPVLVDEGRALGDSGAIAHHLDRAYPERRAIWPSAIAEETVRPFSFERAEIRDPARGV